MAILLNVDEGTFSEREQRLSSLAKVSDQRPCLALSACIEEEIGQLAAEEQREFLSDLGLEEPARNRLIRQCFDVLGYLSFFTVGEDEVRAWMLRRGETAVRAASRIHTDLERGFIRAEVFSYDDLRRLGNVPTVKKEGLWRLEGKEYVVVDGDILCIRANT
jgi:ribosome-binding ATPase YchF (GTP1/OBG family)